MVLLPQDWMPFWNERWKPLMSDIIAITVATPMTMPSSASSERIRFAVSAWRAIRSVSRNSLHADMTPSVAYRWPRVERGGDSSRSASSASRRRLLVAEGVHRVEARGAHGRVEPEEDADHARDEQAQGHRPRRDERGQRRQGAH